MKTLRFYVPGVLLILVALIVVIVPQILVAFVAALLIMAGIGILHLGHIIRKSGHDSEHLDRRFWEDDLSRWQFQRVPNHRT